ncbi:hypothetical protein ATANTOWER_024244 [Ataeniobius toweri]|nr:hypothetical protein [Ataeniobius toweri]
MNQNFHFLGIATCCACPTFKLLQLCFSISQFNIPASPVHGCPGAKDVLSNSKLWIFCPTKSAHIVAALWGPNNLVVPNQTDPPAHPTTTTRTQTLVHTHTCITVFLASSVSTDVVLN